MKTRWFWAVFLVASAVVLITSQLGWLPYHLGVLTLLLTIILVAALISSLRNLNMPGVVFAGAFLAMLYAKPLQITALVPWTILGAALLLSIGLSLIIHPRYSHYRFRQRERYHHGHHDWAADSTGTLEGTDVNVNLSFGNSIRYIHSSDFQSANVRVSMGGAKLYFDDVHLHDNQATVNIDLSLGSLELYVPKEWQLQFSFDNNMGHVTETGQATTAGPVVQLTGRISMAELSLIYI